MSGSSGNTNAGGDRARSPRHGNDDVSARHRETGPQQVKGGSPEESARGEALRNLLYLFGRDEAVRLIRAG